MISKYALNRMYLLIILIKMHIQMYIWTCSIAQPLSTFSGDGHIQFVQSCAVQSNRLSRLNGGRACRSAYFLIFSLQVRNIRSAHSWKSGNMLTWYSEFPCRDVLQENFHSKGKIAVSNFSAVQYYAWAHFREWRSLSSRVLYQKWSWHLTT